jgi:Cu/Ag efflux protein CusF
MRIRSRVPHVLACALLAAASLPAAAQKPAGDTPPATLSGSSATAPGKAMGEGTLKTTATIVSIEAATRGVTLKRQDGKVVTLTLSDEVRNFDQLKVGDKVIAEYSQAIALELKKGGGAAAAATGGESVKRSDPGQKPGGQVMRQVSVLADVVNVDAKKKLVTIKGPAGNLVDLQVEDPAQLKNIKKGDQVQALYSESLAVKVEPAK